MAVAHANPHRWTFRIADNSPRCLRSIPAGSGRHVGSRRCVNAPPNCRSHGIHTSGPSKAPSIRIEPAVPPPAPFSPVAGTIASSTPTAGRRLDADPESLRWTPTKRMERIEVTRLLPPRSLPPRQALARPCSAVSPYSCVTRRVTYTAWSTSRNRAVATVQFYVRVPVHPERGFRSNVNADSDRC